MSNQIPISVIILTKNEANAIPSTLKSVEEFAEVFVVDSNSADATVSLVQESSAKLVNFSWDGKYPKKKQWSLEELPFSHDWVLYLDADETPSKALVEELKMIFTTDEPSRYAAYDVHLDYHFLGESLKHGHKVSKRVLVRKSRTTWPIIDDLGAPNMWEVEGHYQPIVCGPVGRLRSPLKHDDPDPLFDYFQRHNRYSDWEAHLARSSGLSNQADSNRTKGGQRFRRVPMKPLLFFLYSYILRSGFLDGMRGFHYAVAHSFYYWQIGIKTRFEA